MCFAQISLQRNDASNNGRKQWGRGLYKRVKEEAAELRELVRKTVEDTLNGLLEEEAAELGEVRRHKMWERASDGVRGRRRRRM